MLPLKPHPRRSLSIALALGLLLAACGNSAPRPEPLALLLNAQDIKFDVNTLSAQVGQPVILTYINQGVIDHAFVIDGFVEEQTVSPGQTTTLNFTAVEAGTFKFYCAIPGHEAAGMTGELIVTQ